VQSPQGVCALCAELNDLRLTIENARQYMARMSWQTVQADLQRDFQEAMAWPNFLGQSGRRREWIQHLRGLQADFPLLRPPAGPPQAIALRGHTIAWAAVRLGLLLEELHAQPEAARKAHRYHAPTELHSALAEATPALMADNKSFSRRKARTVERMVARLVGLDATSWRAVRRAVKTWRTAAQAGNVDVMLYGRRARPFRFG